MFVSPAFAQATDAAPAGGGFGAFIPLILIFVVFYFLIIRPQSQKMKKHKEMLSQIRRGDRIVTGGGIVGTVSKVVDDNTLQVEIAENVKVKVRRELVSTVEAKTEPVKGEGGKSGQGGGDAGGDAGGGDQAASPGARLKGLLGGKKDND